MEHDTSNENQICPFSWDGLSEIEESMYYNISNTRCRLTCNGIYILCTQCTINAFIYFNIKVVAVAYTNMLCVSVCMCSSSYKMKSLTNEKFSETCMYVLNKFSGFISFNSFSKASIRKLFDYIAYHKTLLFVQIVTQNC